MYSKKRKKNPLIKIVCLCLLLIILLLVSLQLNRKTTKVEGLLKDISITMNKIVMYPFTSLTKEKGKNQSESYIIQKNVNTSLEEEIQELKQTLELNKTLTEYQVENATILSRNKSYWFQNLTVDKGKKDGIKEGMAVITKKGLIGKISKVTNYSSEIKLITADDINYKVSIAIKTSNGENYAVLNGYDKETGQLKVVGVDKNTQLKKGDVVVTSGLGGVFPAGIYIGVVESMESDKYNLSETLYIKTEQDFNQIHYVTILKEKTK